MSTGGEQNCLKKALVLVTQEIVRGILQKQKRYPNTIAKLLREMIDDDQFQFFDKSITESLQLGSSNNKKDWMRSFLGIVPDVVQCHRGNFRLKQTQQESANNEMITENLSVLDYRQKMLSQMIYILLDSDLSDINHLGKNNNTLLHIIASLPTDTQETFRFQTELLELLSEGNPDYSLQNYQNMTPLRIIVGNHLLDPQKNFVLSEQRGPRSDQNTIGRHMKLSCLEPLIGKPYNDRGQYGNSILHEWILYCVDCHVNELPDAENIIGQWIISIAKIPPNVVNELGCTPLHYAYTTRLIEFLCKYGSDAERKNVDGDTPLLYIIKHSLFQSLPNNRMPDGTNAREKFADLINYGNQRKQSQQSILDLKYETFENNGFDLMANDEKDSNCLDYLLLSVTILSQHCTTVPNCLELLIHIVMNWIMRLTKKGGAFESTNVRVNTLSELITVLFYLGAQAQDTSSVILSCIEELLETGADPNKTVFPEFNPVLHFCCMKTVQGNLLHLKLVRLLCEYGADKSKRNRKGKTLYEVLQSSLDLQDIYHLINDTKPKRRIDIRIMSVRYNDALDKLCRQANPERIDECRYDRQYIAKGAMSCIYLSIDEKSRREMALKRIDKNFFQKEIQAEIEALKKLEQNQNVVNFYTLKENKDFYYIAIELMDGDLTDLVKEKKQYLSNGNNTRKLATDIVGGLEFLHGHGMIHRDIKPGNILYREKPQMSVKLADFGLTKHMDASVADQSSVVTTTSTSLCGTRGWMAPELVTRRQKAPTKDTDMYALGLVLHFLFTKGYHPFHSSTVPLLVEISTGSLKPHELETRISKGLGLMRKDLSPEQRDLVKCLLSMVPRARPISSGLIKKHCYFWSSLKKVKFMWTIGDQPEVAKPTSTPGCTFGSNLQSSPFGISVSMNNWNAQISRLFQEVAARGRYNTSSVLGLIRFFRNAYAHYEERSPDRKAELLNDNIFVKFPEFFITVWEEVFEQGWSTPNSGKDWLLRIINEMD